MLIVKDYTHCPPEATHGVVALGNFDGVHRGHQAVIQKTCEIARQADTFPAIMTFEPHPLNVLYPEKALRRITPEHEKIRLFEQYGIETVYIVPFTRAFSQIRAEEFITTALLKQVKAAHIVTGQDFIFGHNREGNAALIKSLSETHHFGYTQIMPLSDDGVIYSSTAIRECLGRGDIASASRLLGHDYEIEGEVVTGHKRGKALGFPTANIIPQELPAAAPGIYVAEARIDGDWHQAAASLGTNPTFGEGRVTLEVFILDGHYDLYGKKIRVRLREYIRTEAKFSGTDALKAAMAEDCVIARTYFEKKLCS